MLLVDFTGYSLLANAGIYLVAAAAVWWAGTGLARYADAISEFTGLGSALIGLLLLGGITSLPEIATSVTAGFSGAAGLAVSNIMGGVALQVVIIFVGDALLRRGAMTARIAKPTVLLQAVLSVLLLCVVIAGTIIGDVAVFGVGLWSTGIFFGGIGMLWLVSQYRGHEAWRPHPAPEIEPVETERSYGLRRAIWMTVLVSLVILVAGYALAKSGEAIAEKSGLGGNFVGATLVAAATSLPEVSTVVAAVRLRRYMMAFSDIFGTNIFDLMLIFVIDVAYRGAPVLNEQGDFAALGAVIGIAVTLIYAAGLIERRDKVFLRIGIDSWGGGDRLFGRGGGPLLAPIDRS